MLPARAAALTAALSLAVAAPAFAGTVLPLAPFHGLDLHGGGNVVLKHGATQKVTILSGSTEYSSFTVKNGNLDINGCISWWSCPRHYDLRVEIVTPALNAIDVHGGGELRSEGNFPRQNELSIEVHGGGDVDLRSIPVLDVHASVHGGGDLKMTAVKSLTGEVSGGGDLTYWGNPPQLQVSTHGGGDISRGD